MSETITNILDTIETRLDNVEYLMDLLEDNNAPVDSMRKYMDNIRGELIRLNVKYEDTHE